MNTHEEFQEYQRLMLEHPKAKIFDTQHPGALFERLHIDQEIAFGACLRRTDNNPTFQFLIPAARLQ